SRRTVAPRPTRTATSSSLSEVFPLFPRRLAGPEAKPAAARDEFRAPAGSVKRFEAVVQTLRHAGLLKERQRRFDIADELHVGERVGDEIARGGFLRQECRAVLRR